MTVATSVSRFTYAGNGSTTAFAYPAYFLDNTHLVVIWTTAAGVETTKVLTTDYTVSGAGVPAGGTVTMTSAPPAGTTVVIYRDPPVTQLTDLVANDPMPADEVEKMSDKLTMIVQRLVDRYNSFVLRLSEGNVSGASLILPQGMPGQLLGWNANGTALINYPLPTVSPVSGIRNTTVFSATAGQTAFTVPTYDPSLVDVYLNGVLLGAVDYTKTNSTTITLAVGATLGDEVVVQTYGYFVTSNALLLSGGTMTGAIALAGPPTQALHPATKAYVDAAVATPTIGATCNFTGATGATLSANNVASVVRTATGTYNVTMSAALPDANYIVSAVSMGAAGNMTIKVSSRTPSTFTLTTVDVNTGPFDFTTVGFFVMKA